MRERPLWIQPTIIDMLDIIDLTNYSQLGYHG